MIKYLGCVGLSFASYMCFKICFIKYGGALILPEDITHDKQFTVYCLRELLNGFKLYGSLLFEQRSINAKLPQTRCELQRLVDQDQQD